MSSLAASTKNGKPSFGELSCLPNFGCDIEQGSNSPTRKIKSTLDSWNTINGVKSNSGLQHECKRVNHACEKFGKRLSLQRTR